MATFTLSLSDYQKCLRELDKNPRLGSAATFTIRSIKLLVQGGIAFALYYYQHFLLMLVFLSAWCLGIVLRWLDVNSRIRKTFSCIIVFSLVIYVSVIYEQYAFAVTVFLCGVLIFWVATWGLRRNIRKQWQGNVFLCNELTIRFSPEEMDISAGDNRLILSW